SGHGAADRYAGHAAARHPGGLSPCGARIVRRAGSARTSPTLVSRMDRRRFLQTASGAGALRSILQAAEPDPALVKATEAVLAAMPTAEADPERPSYHFRPPANWTNDPNGTIYYKGWHHLFYQLNPFAARLGSQHWGHARSRDLVNWEHLPIAIWPSEERGERAIFSGGAAIAADGRPRLFYTSIGKPQPEQWMVIPKGDDLIAWEKYAGNPIL